MKRNFYLSCLFVGVFFISCFSITNAQVGNILSSSSVEILSPKAGMLYEFGSDLYVFWKPSVAPVNYYYITIHNNKISDDFGVLVGQVSSTATTSYVFQFDQSILKTFLANSNYSESYLQDSYYLKVVGVRRGILSNVVVDQNNTGNFSISPSSGIIVDDANIENPSIFNVNGKKINYIFSTYISLYNASSTGLYINKNPVYRLSDYKATTSMTLIGESGMLNDTSGYLYIEPGQKRKFFINSVVSNGGVSKNIKASILGLNTIENPSANYNRGYVDLQKNNLSVSEYLDGLETISSSNGTSTAFAHLMIVNKLTNKKGIYRFVYQLKVNIKAQTVPIYIAKVSDQYSGPIVFEDDRSYNAIPDYVYSTSNEDVEDTNRYYYVAPGKSRDITFSLAVDNNCQNGPCYKILKAKSIRFGYSPSDLKSDYISLEKLNLSSFANFDYGESTGNLNNATGTNSVYIKNQSANLVFPVTKNNKIIGYSFKMFGTIVNTNDYPVYIRNKNDGQDIVWKVHPSQAGAGLNRVFSPSLIKYDLRDSIYIGENSSRDFYIIGSIYNNEYNGPVSLQIESFSFATSSPNNDFVRKISDGIWSLRVSAKFDQASSTYYGTSTVRTPKIDYLSTYSGLSGTIVQISGSDFCLSGNSNVVFSNGRISSSDTKTDVSKDGKTVKFTVPNLPKGQYKVLVESNTYSTSQLSCNPSNTVNFTIGEITKNSPTPLASSIIPKNPNSYSSTTATTTAKYPVPLVTVKVTPVPNSSATPMVSTIPTSPAYSVIPTPVYSATPSPVYSSTPTPAPVYSAVPTTTPTPIYTPTPVYSITPTPTPSTSVSPSNSSSPSGTLVPSPTPSTTGSPTSYNNRDIFMASVIMGLKLLLGL